MCKPIVLAVPDELGDESHFHPVFSKKVNGRLYLLSYYLKKSTSEFH